jgi:hypothetical protein
MSDTTLTLMDLDALDLGKIQILLIGRNHDRASQRALRPSNVVRYNTILPLTVQHQNSQGYSGRLFDSAVAWISHRF